ncbi:hypothetical protein ACFOPS_02575 [Ralstonia solanacearum]|uniref:hypothetical protein n=1 Tax=Ralstonia solanacearum TaxID=305 RepID=UPI0036241357
MRSKISLRPGVPRAQNDTPLIALQRALQEVEYCCADSGFASRAQRNVSSICRQRICLLLVSACGACMYAEWCADAGFADGGKRPGEQPWIAITVGSTATGNFQQTVRIQGTSHISGLALRYATIGKNLGEEHSADAAVTCA